jgi:hypothetical protein
MGAQDSCLKAVLSAVVPSEKRRTAFGIFDIDFGVAWFAGSAIMGLLCDKSVPALALFSVVLHCPCLPLPTERTRQSYALRGFNERAERVLSGFPTRVPTENFVWFHHRRSWTHVDMLHGLFVSY